MKKISKYTALYQYLIQSGAGHITLSFAQIEEILGFRLSDSAYQYQAFWSNTRSHQIACSWLDAGYKTQQVSIRNESVTFTKSDCITPGLQPSAKSFPHNQFPLLSPEDASSLILDYYNATVSDPHGRYMSWRHCYNTFSSNRNCVDDSTLDYLALHLAFYLASWGMYRGSSFLLQKDYKVHIPIVAAIQEHRYDPLLGISAENLCTSDALLLIDDLSRRIKSIYANESPSFEGTVNNATDTLVSKILLGTLGCVPAYDRYYIESVKRNHISSGLFNRSSIKSVAEYYLNHKDVFEPLRKELCGCGTIYPPMKLMDMCFWMDGFQADSNHAKD